MRQFSVRNELDLGGYSIPLTADSTKWTILYTLSDSTFSYIRSLSSSIKHLLATFFLLVQVLITFTRLFLFK